MRASFVLFDALSLIPWDVLDKWWKLWEWSQSRRCDEYHILLIALVFVWCREILLSSIEPDWNGAKSSQNLFCVQSLLGAMLGSWTATRSLMGAILLMGHWERGVFQSSDSSDNLTTEESNRTRSAPHPMELLHGLFYHYLIFSLVVVVSFINLFFLSDAMTSY